LHFKVESALLDFSHHPIKKKMDFALPEKQVPLTFFLIQFFFVYSAFSFFEPVF